MKRIKKNLVAMGLSKSIIPIKNFFLCGAVILFLNEELLATTFDITLDDASTAAVTAGAVDQEILRVRVSNPNGGGQGTGTITGMDFTPTLDANNTNITGAKLYYTGTSSTFATTTQLGVTDVDLSDGISFTFSQSMNKGSSYYFWLAYDIDASAANCTEYDASQVSGDITTTDNIGSYTDNATGKRVLEGPGCWTYCSSSWSNNSDDWISNVTFNTINNSTSAEGYGDYTNISTTVIAGASYTLSVDVSVPAGSFTQHVWAWLDFNNDGDFDEANEAFDLGDVTGTCDPCATLSTTVTIPAGAVLGDTRMRIIEKYNSDPTSCESGTYGETEDYTVSIIDEMVYSSSRVTQNNTTGVNANTTDNEVIGIEVVMVGSKTPKDLTSITINTTGDEGTDNPGTNIANAKVFFTGTSNGFSTATQFGTTEATPNGSFTVTGTVTLSEDTNYFWLTYDVQSGAVLGERIDASCTSVTVDGSAHTPGNTSIAGHRPIGGISAINTQVTDIVGINTVNNEVIAIEVYNENSSQDITSFTLNTNGTSATVTDQIENAKLFYTGTDGNFSTATQYGSTVAAPDGGFTITGTQTLAIGTNYFWLSYDVKSTATIGNVIDGECSSIIVNSNSISVNPSAPSGSRPISESWTGSVDTDWGNTGNWASGALPTSTEDVFIPGTAPNMPLIDGDEGLCRDIYIASGASLTITGSSTTNTLKLYGNMINNGTVSFLNCSGGPAFFNGIDKTISGTGTWTNSGAAYDGIDIGYNVSGASYTQEMDVGPVIWLANSFGSGNGTWDQNGYNLTTDIFELTAGETHYQGEGVLEIQESTPNMSGNWNEETGTTYFNCTAATSPIYDEFDDHTFHNVKVKVVSGYTAHCGSGAAPNCSGYFEFVDMGGGTATGHWHGNMNVDGYFKVGPGWTADAGSYNLNVAGNWINDATFNAETSTVILDGASAQSVQGTSITTFNNLTVNNSSAAGVTLNQQANVAAGLTLTDGIVYTDATNILHLQDNATSTSGSSASFVDGPMDKTGDDAFVFPVGDGTIWARIGISAPASTSAKFQAQYFDAVYSDTTTDASLNHVSSVEHWILDRLASTDAVDVTLYWEDATRSGIQDDSSTDLRVAKYNGTDWTDMGQASISGTSPGSVTSNSVSTFSPFTFGSLTGNNTLPIELLSFQAVPDKDIVKLDWTTASEINNDFFTVERSKNGKEFEKVGIVKGAGSTTETRNYSLFDERPYEGVSYYRLKQTDYNGEFEYSDLVAVDLNKGQTPEIQVFPNPVKDELIISVKGNKSAGQGMIRIFDITGKQVYNKPFEGDFNRFIIDASHLDQGMYFVSFSSNSSTVRTKFVKD